MTSYKNLLLLGTLALLVTGCEKAHDAWQYLKHGKKIQVRELSFFYRPPVTEEEVTKLGNYLVKQLEEDEDSVTWKVQKTGATYEVLIPVKTGLNIGTLARFTFMALADELSQNVFKYSKTDIHITDDDFKTQEVLPCYQCYGWVTQREREKKKARKATSSE